MIIRICVKSDRIRILSRDRGTNRGHGGATCCKRRLAGTIGFVTTAHVCVYRYEVVSLTQLKTSLHPE